MNACRLSFWTGLVAAGLSLSCTSEKTHEVVPLSEVPAHAFAVVGARALHLSLLEPFEPAERRSVAERVVRDELLRTEAEAVGPARARVVSRGELARRLIEVIEAEIRDRAEVTEAELHEEYDKRWLEFDRPRAVRTVQVFFPVSPPMDDDAQYENAERLLAAVEGTHNLEQFGARAKPVLDEVPQNRVFEMPPLSQDGRIVPMTSSDFDVGGISERLAEAVAALSHAGEISSIVGTKDGYHVFLATEVVPAKTVPLDEVREELNRAVVARKVEVALDAISKQPSVEVERRRTDISNLLTLVQEGQ